MSCASSTIINLQFLRLVTVNNFSLGFSSNNIFLYVAKIIVPIDEDDLLYNFLNIDEASECIVLTFSSLNSFGFFDVLPLSTKSN